MSGREVDIDAEIAEKIMGAVWRMNYRNEVRVLAMPDDEYLSQFPVASKDVKLGGDWNNWLPAFSTDIGPAMQVVEVMRGRGYCIHIDAFPDLEYKVTVRKDTGETFNSDACAFIDLPRAICEAALSALAGAGKGKG